MAGTNFIFPFAQGGGANALSDAAWATVPDLGQGFQSGILPSIKLNKALRQGTAVASGFGQFTALWSGVDFSDSLTPNQMATNFGTAVASYLDGTRTVVDTSTVANILKLPFSPLPASTNTDFTFWFQPNVTNNGATTITIVKSDGSTAFGALPVKQRTGADVASGDLVKGYWYEAICTGTTYTLVAPTMSELTGSLTGVSTIATALVKTVYGVGADFPDLNTALAWLNPRRILPTGSVKFVLGAGQWVHDQPAGSVSIQHPDLNRVSIVGATLTNGGFPVFSNMAVTGSSGAQRTADLNTNLATARTRIPTELRFTGSASIQVIGTLGLLQDVLITGDLSAVSGLSLTAGTQTLNRVAIAGFGNHGLYTRTTLAIVLGALWCFGNSGSGVYAGATSTVNYLTGNIYATGNGNNGINTTEGSSVTTQSAGLSIVAWGNAIYGAAANYNSSVLTGTSGSFSMNGSHGVAALTHSVILANAASSVNNGGYGLYAGQGSFIVGTGSSVNGNTAGAFGANQNSFIDATGYAGSGTFSPAVNTTGNGNSSIQA